MALFLFANHSQLGLFFSYMKLYMIFKLLVNILTLYEHFHAIIKEIIEGS